MSSLNSKPADIITVPQNDGIFNSYVLLAGTSGLAKEYAITIRRSRCGFKKVPLYRGCFGPEPPIKDEDHNILAPYLGTDKDIGSLINHPEIKHLVMVAVGNPNIKEKIVKNLEFLYSDIEYATFIHPTSIGNLEYNSIGAGSIIQPQCSLTGDIKIGRHVIINQLVSVGHNARIGDYSTINPLVSVSGDTVIGECVLVGTGASILERLTIGAGAIVGAGAVVVRDVEPGTTVVGVPAKPLKKKQENEK